MNKISYLLLVLLTLFVSCSDDNEVPTTGNAVLLADRSTIIGSSYYIVSEQYFLTADNPNYSRDALLYGTIEENRTPLPELNAGVYYVVYNVRNSGSRSKAMQIKAGETIEVNLWNDNW